MSLYQELLGLQEHSFFAVVHTENERQMVRNIGIAQDGGADGVFLINHVIPSTELGRLFKIARKSFPGFWMGVNVLDLDPVEACELVPNFDCLWVDDAGIRNSGDCSEAQEFLESYSSNKKRDWLYFGGVAFKGQEPITNLSQTARLAIPFMDVITTSGAGTGIAPDVGKLRTMRAAIGDHPLAVASGITPENVHLYLPYVDCFLVATGISDSDTELNPNRVRMLVNAIHNA